MTALLVAFVLTNVAWLVFTLREREREREERAELLNRIQAPEAAVLTSMADGEKPGALHVPFDDDEQFFEAVAERAR